MKAPERFLPDWIPISLLASTVLARFFVLLAGLSLANQACGQNAIQAVRATIAIDGKMEDLWSKVPATSVIKVVDELTTLKKKQCPTAKVKCAWDQNHLYVLADIEDSVISTRNGNAWAQDSIEFFIDPDCSRGKSLGNGDCQYRISAVGKMTFGGSGRKELAQAKVVAKSGGYRIEAAFQIPKVYLQKDQKIGFEIQINNDPGTGQRESVTKWNHPNNESWRSTADYGTLILVGEHSLESEAKQSGHSLTEQTADLLTQKNSKTSSNTILTTNVRGPETRFVPDWAKDAVFYQIFPERFRNGDKSNDPTRKSLEFPDIIPENWAVTNWTDQWYKRSAWEQAIGSNFYEDGVFHRRYGGDLQGVIDKLDYVADLGINTIYFNPVFYARSLHKYDGNSFHHVDPHFGPDPEGDFAIMEQETADPATWKWTAADKLFLKLLRAAKARDLRVIIDGVFNHTGRDFFAFKDIAKNQQASPYRHWYMVEQYDDPATEENEFKYKGWWGVDTLPEFANNEAGDDLHPDPKKYVMTATARWMDPNGDGDPADGVAGWRLDVANEVPNKFWQDWNRMVRKINPEAYTVAEIWDNAADYLADCEFSATMNYHGFAFPCKGFLIDGRLSPSKFAELIQDRLQEHSPDVRYALQNLLDSHDTDRVASMIVNARYQREYLNADRYDYDVGERVSPRYAKEYDVTVPNNDSQRLLRLVAMFQMTFVGAPMIYYGTECGMDGADDPDDRMPMVWSDLEYEKRSIGPKGEALPIQYSIGVDESLLAFYQALIGMRNSNEALRRGGFEVLHTDDEKKLLVFLRELGDEKILVAINRGDAATSFDLSGQQWVDKDTTFAEIFHSVGSSNAREAGPSGVPQVGEFWIDKLAGQVWRVGN